MFTIYTLKALTQLINRVERIRTKLLLKPSSIGLFPLLKKNTHAFMPNGVYLRRFQAHVSAIPGMITDVEANALFQICASQNLNGDVVEIGSWLGKSTVHLALGCKVTNNGIVHAVDTFKGNPGKEYLYNAPLAKNETIYDRFKKHVLLAGVSKQIDVHKMTSESAKTKIKKKLRLVFIDGCHEYEPALNDIRWWGKKLQKGGLLLLDDFTHQFPGVIRAVQEEIVNKPKEFTVLYQYDSLLVVKKND